MCVIQFFCKALVALYILSIIRLRSFQPKHEGCIFGKQACCLLALSTYSSLCSECVQFPLFWVRTVPYSFLTVASLLWMRTVPFVSSAYSSLCPECVQFLTVSLQSPPCSEYVQFPLPWMRTVPFVLSAYSSLQLSYSRLLVRVRTA
jgi:hypothetical protein